MTNKTSRTQRTKRLMADLNGFGEEPMKQALGAKEYHLALG
jgi:hypothetical protein